MLGHLRHDAIDVGPWQIAFVGSHNDRYTRSLSMRDGLFGLRHDPVIGRDDQDRNVSHVGSSGSHLGESLVTRCIDKRYGTTILLDLISPNMLGDPTGFARDDLRTNQIIQQRRLAVVDVPEERDDRRPRDQILCVVDKIIKLGNHTRLERLGLLELKINT